MKQIGVKWPEDLLEKIDKAANAQAVPRSVWLRQAAERALARQEALPPNVLGAERLVRRIANIPERDISRSLYRPEVTMLPKKPPKK